MRQIHFNVASDGAIQIEGFPAGSDVRGVPRSFSQRMLDMRLHANDLDQALAAIKEVKTDSKEFSIVNIALFTAALVFYFRCFKSSASRAKLDPMVVFAHQPAGAMEGHRFYEGIRDKHSVHDENNYFIAEPVVVLRPDAPPTPSDCVIAIIAQAGIDRDPKYVALLRDLVVHAKAWAEREADRETTEIAARLSAMSRAHLLALPHGPRISMPVRGDERKKR